MATFEFRSEGIKAGYSGKGFFAHGETTRFGFDENEYPGHDLPSIRSKRFEWSIHTHGEDPWKQYSDIIDAYAFDRENWPKTDREAEIMRVFSDRPRVGLFMQWRPGEVSLHFSLASSPELATVIMGAIAAGREIDLFCQGFLFANEDRPGAAAPTVSGWTERKEPLILTDHPIITVA